MHCLAMDIVLLRAIAPAGMCLPRRCLVMGIHVNFILEDKSVHSHRRKHQVLRRDFLLGCWCCNIGIKLIYYIFLSCFPHPVT
jgi:hypothetical protein